MNNNVWSHIIDELKALTSRPIMTLELPGYGDRENAIAEHTVESLSAWLDTEISQPVTLVGWSLGGLVATQFALDFPHKVNGLGLIASSPKFIADGDWPGIQPAVLSNFATDLADNHQTVIARFMAIQAMGSETAKQDIKQIKSAVLAKATPTPAVLGQGLQILQQADLRPRLAELTMPTHMILGRLDALVSAKMVNQLSEITNNIEITVVNKASHAPFISHPEAFKTWFAGLIER